MLFYANHPFEGAKVVACPCMTEAFEKKFYGSEAVFIYDPNDKSNLPVRGIHQNVIRRWPVMPAELRETFIREFSPEMLKNPQKRMIEQNWEKLIASLRDRLVTCPHCGDETFIDESKPRCMNCKRDVDVSRKLKLGLRTLLLTNGTRLFIDFDNTPDARVTLNPQDKSMLLLQNLTKERWTAETPSGKLKAVEPNDFMPVKHGIKVSFSAVRKGVIIINNQ